MLSIFGSRARRILTVICLSAVLVPVGAWSEPAAADDYAGCVNTTTGSGCIPDNYYHTYCLGTSTNGLTLVRQAIATAMDIMVRDTNMATSNGPSGGCNDAIDIRWQEAGVSTGNLASYSCLDRVIQASGRRYCEYSTIIINRAAHTQAANTAGYGSDGNEETGEIPLNLDLSACHEVGHSLGFRHFENPALTYYDDHDNDCQRSPWLEVERANDGWRAYNGDHRGHINGEI